MAETLINYILDLFNNFTSLKYGKEVLIFIISMIPILELRGGLIAASLLGVNYIKSFIICLIGNIIPIPFILWLITPIFSWLKQRKLLKGFIEKLENRAIKKKDKIEKIGSKIGYELAYQLSGFLPASVGIIVLLIYAKKVSK